MKVQKIIIIAALFSSLLIAACNQKQPEEAEQSKSTANTAPEKEVVTADVEIIATVNGKNISMESFQEYMQQKLAQNPTDAGDPALILNEMINRELLLQAAHAEAIDKKPEVAEQIKFSSNNILVNSLVNEKVSQLDTSDTVLKAEYEEQIKDIELKEYKARHILVNSEEDATAVLKGLGEGKDFAALAKEKSVGPSGPKGGDLGWFQAETMVPEFAEALKTMQKGDISKTAVRTQFGWHIIKLEDSRDMEAPGFEESKARLKTIVVNKAVQNYMEELRNKASIDIKEPKQAPANVESAPSSKTPTQDTVPETSEKTPEASK